MRKRQVHKPHAFSVRVPDKTRFGIDLLCKKNGVQLSTLIVRAVEDLFEKEGLGTRKPGEMFSLLDKLWDENPAVRWRNIATNAPEFLSAYDMEMLQILRDTEKELGREFNLKELENWYSLFIPTEQHP